MKPTVGRIVHYVPYGHIPGVQEFNHLAAIVTKVTESRVSLTTFSEQGMLAFSGVEQDESGANGHSWHWPERDES